MGKTNGMRRLQRKIRNFKQRWIALQNWKENVVTDSNKNDNPSCRHG